MILPKTEQYDDAIRSFARYVSAVERLADDMAAIGIQIRNVDPFANFAEVVVSRAKGGLIQVATNAGFDVLTPDSMKIQVKSLRVSSAKPRDNGVDWLKCTRIGGNLAGRVINADRLAIVVYLDFRPYSLVEFPIAMTDSFPVLGVTVMFFAHVQRLIDGASRLADTGVSVTDLSGVLATCESK